MLEVELLVWVLWDLGNHEAKIRGWKNNVFGKHCQR